MVTPGLLQRAVLTAMATRRRYHIPFFGWPNNAVLSFRKQARRAHPDAQIVSLRRGATGLWYGCLSTAVPLDRDTRGLFVRERPGQPRRPCRCTWR